MQNAFTLSKKTIQLRDQRSGMPCPATLGNYRNGEVYEIGPVLLSVEDILRLAEHALVNGPSNDTRQRFVQNVCEFTTGEGAGGVKVFRPSIQRTLAGTAAGL